MSSAIIVISKNVVILSKVFTENQSYYDVFIKSVVNPNNLPDNCLIYVKHGSHGIRTTITDKIGFFIQPTEQQKNLIRLELVLASN